MDVRPKTLGKSFDNRDAEDESLFTNQQEQRVVQSPIPPPRHREVYDDDGSSNSSDDSTYLKPSKIPGYRNTLKMPDASEFEIIAQEMYFVGYCDSRSNRKFILKNIDGSPLVPVYDHQRYSGHFKCRCDQWIRTERVNGRHCYKVQKNKRAHDCEVQRFDNILTEMQNWTLIRGDSTENIQFEGLSIFPDLKYHKYRIVPASDWHCGSNGKRMELLIRHADNRQLCHKYTQCQYKHATSPKKINFQCSNHLGSSYCCSAYIRADGNVVACTREHGECAMQFAGVVQNQKQPNTSETHLSPFVDSFFIAIFDKQELQLKRERKQGLLCANQNDQGFDNEPPKKVTRIDIERRDNWHPAADNETQLVNEDPNSAPYSQGQEPTIDARDMKLPKRELIVSKNEQNSSIENGDMQASENCQQPTTVQTPTTDDRNSIMIEDEVVVIEEKPPFQKQIPQTTQTISDEALNKWMLSACQLFEITETSDSKKVCQKLITTNSIQNGFRGIDKKVTCRSGFGLICYLLTGAQEEKVVQRIQTQICHHFFASRETIQLDDNVKYSKLEYSEIKRILANDLKPCHFAELAKMLKANFIICHFTNGQIENHIYHRDALTVIIGREGGRYVLFTN